MRNYFLLELSFPLPLFFSPLALEESETSPLFLGVSTLSPWKM